MPGTACSGSRSKGTMTRLERLTVCHVPSISTSVILSASMLGASSTVMFLLLTSRLGAREAPGPRLRRLAPAVQVTGRPRPHSEENPAFRPPAEQELRPQVLDGERTEWRRRAKRDAAA